MPRRARGRLICVKRGRSVPRLAIDEEQRRLAAALTEPRTAVPVIVENIVRVRRGEAPLHLVDREAGY